MSLLYWTSLIVGISALFTPLSSVFAASSGPNSPSTVSQTTSASVDWANINNVSASDNAYATTSHLAGNLSETLSVTGFAFSIPDTATIEGITVSIERKYTNSWPVVDSSLRLLKSGSAVGNNKADTESAWPSSDAVATYGGSADTWGTTWAPEQINNANFGAAFIAANYCPGDDCGSGFPNIDHITVTIYYAEPNTGGAGGRAVRERLREAYSGEGGSTQTRGTKYFDMDPPSPQDVGIFVPPMAEGDSEEETMAERLQRILDAQRKMRTAMGSQNSPRVKQIQDRLRLHVAGSMEVSPVSKNFQVRVCMRIHHRFGTSSSMFNQTNEQVMQRWGFSC